MNYSEALHYLHSFLNFEVRTDYSYGRDLHLERTHWLLDRLGRPDRDLPSVLIGGTKGKGSTAALLEGIFREGGFRVGLFTSPHLEDLRERVMISGQKISKEDFSGLLSRIRERWEDSPWPPRLGQPTFFEILTALSVLYFSEQKVDLALFEVGMGGRLDATNALSPLLCVITPVSFDHQAKLGRTLAAIAQEKVAIVKRHGSLVSGFQKPRVKKLFQSWVRQKKGKAYFLGEDFSYRIARISEEGTLFDFNNGETQYRELFLRLPGIYQVENASLALQTSFLLGDSFSLSSEALRRALARARWPGRFEIVRGKGRIYVLDGAHNGASIQALLESLREIFPGKRGAWILGISEDKDASRILREMGSEARPLILTQSRNPRAMPVEKLESLTRVYGSGDRVERSYSLEEALRKAEERCSDSLVVVTGSLFLVAEARRILCRN